MRLCIFFSCLLVGSLYGSFPLLEDYTKAKELANFYERPMILLFTGSDWSLSSQKLLEGVLENREFIQKIGKQFIFVKLDFPEKNTFSPSLLMQHDLLREKYEIKEFPVLVMIDQSEREITRLSYLEKEPLEYAGYLKKLFLSYKNLERSVEKAISLEKAEEMEGLYQEAVSLGCSHLQERLLEEGTRITKGVFFPLESYARLINQQKYDSSEAEKLRSLIIERDQKNQQKGRLRLALLDFQANQDNGKEALKYLQSYVEAFGKEDLEQIFGLHLLISEYFERGEEKSTSELVENATP